MNRDDALLLDMLFYAETAWEFNLGMTFEQFLADRKLQLATLHALQIMGEAAAKISPEYREAHSALPWQHIIAFRHRLVHDYAGVDLPRVWAIVCEDLGQAIQALSGLVPPQNK